MRLFALVRTINRDVRGGFATLFGLYLFDALFMSSGAVTFLVGWVMVFLGACDFIARFGTMRGRSGLVTMIAYALLDGAVLGTIRVNDVVACQRADRVIAALEQYKAEHGRYPRRLDELVPRYIVAVPVAKYTLAFNQLRYYSCDGEDAALGYTEVAPFGSWYYSLSSHRWRYVG